MLSIEKSLLSVLMLRYWQHRLNQYDDLLIIQLFCSEEEEFFSFYDLKSIRAHNTNTSTSLGSSYLVGKEPLSIGTSGPLYLPLRYDSLLMIILSSMGLL